MALEPVTAIDGFREWAASLPGSDVRWVIFPDGSSEVALWSTDPRDHTETRKVIQFFQDDAEASDYFTDQGYGEIVTLDASCDCVVDDLVVTIVEGDGPFRIDALLDDEPIEPIVGGVGEHTLVGPGVFTDVTVTELSGDGEIEIINASIECPAA